MGVVRRVAALLWVLLVGCGATVSSAPNDASHRDGDVRADPADVATPGDRGNVGGDGAAKDRGGPTDVPVGPCEATPSEVLQLATWGYDNYARTRGGCLWSWTYNRKSGLRTRPTPMPGLSDVRAISTSNLLVAIIGTEARHLMYQPLEDPMLAPIPNAVDVAASDRAMCAIGTGGAVRCSGRIVDPGLLVETIVAPETPVVGVQDAVRIMTFRSGWPLALLRDGTVVVGSVRLPPSEVPVLRGAVDYASAFRFSCFRMRDGTVKCAGQNDIRVCGPAGVDAYPLTDAQTIPGLSNIVQVAAASETTAYALRADGQLFRWGKVRDPILARGTYTHEPEAVPEVRDAVRIGGSAGGGDLLVLRRDGSVWSLHLPTEDGLPLVERVAGFGPP